MAARGRRTDQWRRRRAAAKSVIEDIGDAVNEGLWSIIHFGTLWAADFPDGTAGLSEGQKAMMVGLYSEFDYA